MGVMIASTISPLAGAGFNNVPTVNTGILDETGLSPLQIHVADTFQSRKYLLEAAFSRVPRCGYYNL